MSRRKQRFPSHITGEGDGVDCQEQEDENISSSVESQRDEGEDASDSTTDYQEEPTHQVTRMSALDDGTSDGMEIAEVEDGRLGLPASGSSVVVGLETGSNHGASPHLAGATSLSDKNSTVVNEGTNETVSVAISQACTVSHESQCHSAVITPTQSTVSLDISDSVTLLTKYVYPYSSAHRDSNSANMCSAKKSVYSIVDAPSSHSHKTSFSVETTSDMNQNQCEQNHNHCEQNHNQCEQNHDSDTEKSCAIIMTDAVHESSSQTSKDGRDFTCEEEKTSVCQRVSEGNLKCPVCDENFRSKRSFNSHILVHCQLVKSPSTANKRVNEDFVNGNVEKKRALQNPVLDEHEPSCIVPSGDQNYPCLPLDLSFKKFENPVSVVGELKTPSKYPFSSSLPFTPPSKGCKTNSIFSDRSPLEDENENLVNESREHEKAFFDHTQNELFLTEDSTVLEPPPPLPMFHSGGVIRKVRVSSDDGPPMVYRIKIHAEQIFVSRILGTNEETGDKIELYKCFTCSLSFPSVSRLQAHLTHHKQRFVCCKCRYSCDSRVQFSHHVQKKHLTKECASNHKSQRSNHSDSSEDSSNAENTVTVAALLSALHGNSISRTKFQGDETDARKTQCSIEDERKPRHIKDSISESSSPDSQMEMGKASETGSSGGGDLFKMFSCRYCGKKFDRAFSCNRHERVHTGYKPCFCRICGRGFSEPRNLRHHVIRFHSDGSLRHLIKRDRRKRREEDGGTPSVSPTPSKEILRESSNKEPTCQVIGSPLNYAEDPPKTAQHNVPNGGYLSNCFRSHVYHEQLHIKNDHQNHFPNSLTEIFAATLDNTQRVSRSENIYFSSNNEDSKPVMRINENSILRICEDSMDQLEPGEIRLNMRTRIVEDDERGRRLIIAEDHAEDGLDHSPQFSAYAPRLDIVQEPVKRDKALRPITDDIGRTFYECPYCYKFFGSTSDLNRHLDFHEDLRPYDCKYCEYSARTNSQLKVHKMRHEGIKQFSCDVCNYNGVTQSDLNRHKKTQSHIARNQNVCAVCGLGFYSNSQKQVHIVKCHPEMEGASSLIQMSLGIPQNSGMGSLQTIDVSCSLSPSNMVSANIINSASHYSVIPSQNIVSTSLASQNMESATYKVCPNNTDSSTSTKPVIGLHQTLSSPVITSRTNISPALISSTTSSLVPSNAAS